MGGELELFKQENEGAASCSPDCPRECWPVEEHLLIGRDQTLPSPPLPSPSEWTVRTGAAGFHRALQNAEYSRGATGANDQLWMQLVLPSSE